MDSIVLKGRTAGKTLSLGALLALFSLGAAPVVKWPRDAMWIARGWLQNWNPEHRQLPVSGLQDVLPGWDAAHGKQDLPMTQADHRAMMVWYQLAYLNVRQGTASEESWSMLALGSNISLVLCELGFGADWLELIQEAQAALQRAKSRGKMLDNWRLDGRGMNDVSDLLDVLEAQTRIAPRKTITYARDVVLQRMVELEAVEIEQHERALK